jgi:hypothetical protein
MPDAFCEHFANAVTPLVAGPPSESSAGGGDVGREDGTAFKAANAPPQRPRGTKRYCLRLQSLCTAHTRGRQAAGGSMPPAGLTQSLVVSLSDPAGLNRPKRERFVARHCSLNDVTICSALTTFFRSSFGRFRRCPWPAPAPSFENIARAQLRLRTSTSMPSVRADWCSGK